jgi:aryl-alcohol dehydrogenase (NADP+)
VRDRILVATKVGSWSERPGLGAENIRGAIGESLNRLQTDHVDLYYAHRDDPQTPLEETLRTFDELVRAGSVRAIGLSNYTAERLAAALTVCDREGLTRPVALQPDYSLVEREDYEGDLRDVCEREGIACVPYFALARGFLSGKYRPGVEIDSPRAKGAARYLNDSRAAGLLEALELTAAAHDAPIAAVAVAWLRAQPTVLAPIASARNVAQLDEIARGATLELSEAELETLANAW